MKKFNKKINFLKIHLKLEMLAGARPGLCKKNKSDSPELFKIFNLSFGSPRKNLLILISFFKKKFGFVPDLG
jgi:hypothetical protein